MSDVLKLEHVLIASFVNQCSVKFRSKEVAVEDWRGNLFDIYAEDGVTYITSGENRKPIKEKYDSVMWVPGDDTDNEEIKKATNELRDFTNQVNDITVSDFALQWGTKDGALPCLLDCSGTFTCSPEAEPFRESLTAIALFIAIESSQRPEPGCCFLNKRSCSGFGNNLQREKIEIHRLKQMTAALGYDAADFVSYVRRRLASVCPETVMSTVPVCHKCFDRYKGERPPAKKSPPRTPVPTPKSSPKPTRASYSPRPMSASVWAVPKRQVANNPSVYRKARSPSGLTYVQDFSGASTRQAAQIYTEVPFRAFLKSV